MFIYFEDNAGVIVNNKGEMKGAWVVLSVIKSDVTFQGRPLLDRSPKNALTSGLESPAPPTPSSKVRPLFHKGAGLK